MCRLGNGRPGERRRTKRRVGGSADSSGGGDGDGDTDSSSGDSDSTESSSDSSGDSSDSDSSDDSDKGGSDDGTSGSSAGDDGSTDADSSSDSESKSDSDDSTHGDDSDSQKDTDDDTGDSSDGSSAGDDSGAGDNNGDGDDSSGDDDSGNETNGDNGGDGNETNNDTGNETPTDPEPDEETTLTVTVVDDETGERLDGEVSIIFPGWGYEFTAEAVDGEAVFSTSDEGIPTVGDDGSDSAEVEFNANVDGYVIEEETTDFTTIVNFQEDNSHTLNLVKEDAEPEQTNLSITLVEQESGDPIEGVEVSIYLEGYGAGASATTNENGVAVFDSNDLPTEGADRSDGKVRIAVDNFTGSGYTYPEGVESASTEIVLKEDNFMTVELVEEDPEPAPEPPGNGTEPPNEPAPNESVPAV